VGAQCVGHGLHDGRTRERGAGRIPVANWFSHV
jgi:hypothetical protein